VPFTYVSPFFLLPGDLSVWEAVNSSRVGLDVQQHGAVQCIHASHSEPVSLDFLEFYDVQGQRIWPVRGACGKDAMLLVIMGGSCSQAISICQMQPEDNEEMRALLDVLECRRKLRKDLYLA